VDLLTKGDEDMIDDVGPKTAVLDAWPTRKLANVQDVIEFLQEVKQVAATGNHEQVRDFIKAVIDASRRDGQADMIEVVLDLAVPENMEKWLRRSFLVATLPMRGQLKSFDTFARACLRSADPDERERLKRLLS
jgi:tetrahydromethanopterin S-methyltransferase subunit B